MLENIIKEATESAKKLADQNAALFAKSAFNDKISNLLKEGVEDEFGDNEEETDVTLGLDAENGDESMDEPMDDEMGSEDETGEFGDDDVEEEIDLTSINDKDELISWIEQNVDDTTKFMFVTNMGNSVSIDDVVGNGEEESEFGGDDEMGEEEEGMDDEFGGEEGEDDEIEENKQIANTRAKNIMDNKIPNVEMNPVMEAEKVWKEAASRNRTRYMESETKLKKLQESFDLLAENQKKLKKALNEQKEQNKNSQAVLKEAKDVITTLAVQNTKISQISTLLQEQNLTVTQKKDIIGKFEKVNTVAESTKLFNVLRESKEAKKPNTTIVENAPSAELPKIVETVEDKKEVVVITEQKTLDKTSGLDFSNFNRLTNHKLGEGK